MADQHLPALPLPADKWQSLIPSLDLPPQQLRIVELVLRNCGDKQVARALGLKLPTVRTYLTRVYERLQVNGRLELVLKLFAMSHDI